MHTSLIIDKNSDFGYNYIINLKEGASILAINRYNPNSRLTRLKMELEEAKNELEHTPGSRRQYVQNRINNIEREIREIEAELDRMASDDYDAS